MARRTVQSSLRRARYGCGPRCVEVSDERQPQMRADAQRNRDKILEATADLVVTRGKAVTVAEIVEAAGVGPPTLYRQFGSKDGLLQVVYERHAGVVATWFKRARAEPTGRAGLRLAIDLLLRE